MLSEKEVKLLEVLNGMIKNCEAIKYKDFNKVIKALDTSKLRELEEKFPEVGLTEYDTKNEGIPTLSIIATITDILIGKRLAFLIEEDGTLSGVDFYREQE